jgi:hypothetical protein
MWFLSVLNALIIDTKIGVIKKKLHLLERIKIMKYNTSNLRRTLIFNSEKCKKNKEKKERCVYAS